MATEIRADHITSRFLLLDQSVVIGLADTFRVLQIEEQSHVALVRDLVIYHCRSWMVAIDRNQQAAATLAGKQVSD
ncbi:hypothetical protein [Mesorhizobium sp. 1B3]|uniref:hypothetical protein n=1 Tax=Mesorhizobium sp. 1B3 TaxID=3243599 RepID=UPI003D958939